jgi:hypothetical protein
MSLIALLDACVRTPGALHAMTPNFLRQAMQPVSFVTLLIGLASTTPLHADEPAEGSTRGCLAESPPGASKGIAST